MSFALSLAASLLMTALLVSPSCGDGRESSEATARETSSAPDREELRAEADLIVLANQERQQRGLGTLETDERLTAAARAHAREMAERRQLSHQFPGEKPLRERLAATGLRFDRAAENVSRSDDARSAHSGLMSSAGHRANILGKDYNAIGVGVVRHGGQIFVAQNFARRLPERSAEQAEEILADAFQRLRREKGLRPLVRRSVPRLGQAACTMAQKDELDTDVDLPMQSRRRVLAFTIAQPEELPPQVEKMASDRSAASFALGACFERTPKYPSGIFWVLMLFED